MNAGYEKSGASLEVNSKGIDKKKESEIPVIKSDEFAVGWDDDIFVSRNLVMCLVTATTRNNKVPLGDIRGGRRVVRQRGIISKIDHFSDKDTAVEMVGALKGQRAETMGNRFEVGDMVWGKIKSFPWWPGYIYDEVLASFEVRKTKVDGCVLVAFFGDGTYNWLDPKELIPFDSHYNEKSKKKSSKEFVEAVEHAVYEVNRRAALGLACPCTSNFRPTEFEEMVNVDMRGYEPDDYSKERIEKARQEFQPVKTLSFLQRVALGRPDMPHDIRYIREAARVRAFRRAVYEKVDEPYSDAFGMNTVGHGDSNELSNNQELAFTEAFVARTRHTSRISQSPGESKRLAKLTMNYPKKNNRKYVPVLLKPKISGKQKLDEIVGQETIAQTLGSSRKEAINVNMKPVAKTSLKKRSEFHVQHKDSLSGQSFIAEAQSESKHVKTVKLQTLRNEPKSSTVGHFSKASGDHFSIKRSTVASMKPEVGGKKNVTKALCCSENEKEASTLDKRPLILNSSSVYAQVLGKDNRVKILVASRDDVDKKQSNMVGRKLKINEESSFREGQESTHKCFKTININKEFGAGETCGANLEDLPPALKPLKKRLQPSSPVEGGKGLVVSDHQKETSRKRVNIQNDMKLVRSWSKFYTSTNSLAPEDNNTKEAQIFLLIKFPPKVTLPSVSELKAKLARFGPLHTSGIRIFWKSSTCEVPFMNRCDAQRAYLHAVNLGTLFGNTKVTLHLHDIEASNPKLAESREPSKLILEEACDRVPPLRSDSDRSESFEPVQSPIHAIPSSSCSYMDGIEAFSDAINMKYLQVEANKISSHHTADVNGVDISEPMLTLMTECSEIVAKLKHPWSCLL